MRKDLLIISFILIFTGINLHGQIKVAANGNVGINNTNPAYNLDVVGSVRFNYSGSTMFFTGSAFYPSGNGISLGNYGGMWAQLWVSQPYFTYQPVILSDMSFKTNIQVVTDMNLKLKMLRPVKYTLTVAQDSTYTKTLNTEQYGFIAQEVKEIFPEMVVPMGEGVWGIRYNDLIPVLVQALKEQQTEIEMLKNEISSIKAKIK